METCNFKQYFHDYILGFGERVQCRVPNRLIAIPMREHELNTAENPIISISTILAIFYFHFIYASAIIFFTYWTLVNEKKLGDEPENVNVASEFANVDQIGDTKFILWDKNTKNARRGQKWTNWTGNSPFYEWLFP